MFSTMSRYLFSHYMGTAIKFALGMLALAFLADFNEYTRRASGLPDFTLGTAALVSLLRVPNILQVAIPFVVLFAAMAALASLNRKYELVIARAAGLSAWQFLSPLLVASFLIGLLMTTVFNPLSARLLSYSQDLEVTMGATAKGGSANNIPWLRQTVGDETMIIGSRATARNGTVLGGVTVLRISAEGTIVERIEAKKATLVADSWQMEDVRQMPTGGQRKDHATFTLPSTLDPALIEERLTAAELVSFFDLPKKIAVAQSFGVNAAPFLTQYHVLIALPALLVAMTLIAATVSLRFARFGQSLSLILTGILAGFLLYVISVLMKAFGSAGIISPIFAAWLPVLIAVFFGVFFLLHKEDG